MAQEFIIKSQDIEDKINQLLPSQGGFQAGVDFSASTMVIPIVDLTETAEGSSLREDLQKSLSLTSITDFSQASTSAGASTTIITTTGYFRIFGTSTILSTSAVVSNVIEITDGTTTKNLFNHATVSTSINQGFNVPFDFIALLEAGDSVNIVSTGASGVARIQGNTRQIADLAKNLINP